MAERRMFARSVVESDNFLDLSIEAQAAYFHLSMYADDDGLLNSVKRIVRTVGVTEAAIDELVAAGFLIKFESGIYAVTDWKVSNCIRKDRYRPTKFIKEFKKVKQDANCRYYMVSKEDTIGIQNDNQTDTQYSTGEYREGEYSLSQDRSEKNSLVPPPCRAGEERKRGAGERETPKEYFFETFDEEPDFEKKKREAMLLLATHPP